MSDFSDDLNSDDDDPQEESASPDPAQPQPLHGQVRHSNISARVPESVGAGVFSNGVMILSGRFEIILDFVLRMGEQQRVVARCVLPKVVAEQFVRALQENIRNYQDRFGKLPQIPVPTAPLDTPQQEAQQQDHPGEVSGHAPASESAEEVVHPENQPAPPHQPDIQDIYDELKMSDELMSGQYANAVLIRHSGTEFCFDFITNFFPKSAVSARIFLAAPHVGPLLSSLERSLTPPGTSQDFA